MGERDQRERPTSWARLCRGEGLEVDGDVVTVSLPAGRRHRVRVTETEATYELSAVAVGCAAVERSLDGRAAMFGWRRNRGTTMVGWRIDLRGRLVGEAWVAKVGVTEGEMGWYLRVLARECDRVEWVVTGEDVE